MVVNEQGVQEQKNGLSKQELRELASLALSKGIILTMDMIQGRSREEILELINTGRIPLSKEEKEDIVVLRDYHPRPEKIDINHFVRYYNKRYLLLSEILRNRPQLSDAVQISRVRKGSRQEYGVIGMVYERSSTSSGSIVLTLEDPSGKLKVFFTKKNKELYSMADDVLVDEVVGVRGYFYNNYFIANQLFFPSIPNREQKKGGEGYIVFVGDTHFGSNLFLEKEFEAFLEWINARSGNPELDDIARRVKYLVITGDVVEGVGIYPGQEEELTIKSIRKQYEKAAEYLSRIPSHIKILVIPGNHDAVRLEEPQPRISRVYAEPLYRLPNVVMLPNPSLVRIGRTESFDGYDLLLYHGYSLVYYAENIPRIRQNGGQKLAGEIMKILLEKRHLSPAQGSNLFVPEDDDHLFISSAPDFFVTGHIHRVEVVPNYKGVTLINSSCWVEISENQERLGLEPQPARVIVTDMASRDNKIINFYMDSLGKHSGMKQQG